MVPNEVVSNECDDVLDNVAPCIEQKCGESALCIQQNDVAKEIKICKIIQVSLCDVCYSL